MSLLKSYLSFARGETALSPWWITYPFGVVARAVVSLRNFGYDHGLVPPVEPPLPVVSVGNITLGGTNKTPFVEMLCRMFLEAGIPVGIVSRGYGGTTKDPVVLSSITLRESDGFCAEDIAALRGLVGDEPLLLASRLRGVPVAVSKDRLRDIEALSDRNVKLIVADDAFQHRRMARDVDIALVDACCPFGNGWVAPAGILREPPAELSRASLVVITKADQVPAEKLRTLTDEIRRFVPEEKIFYSRLSVPTWRRWNGCWSAECCEAPRTVLAFSAIGSPESFRRSLEQQGITIVREHRFKDHHRYGREDMEMLEKAFAGCGAEAMTCTEKDIYNLPTDWRPSRDILVPLISTELDDEPRFRKALAGALRPRIVVASNGYGEDSMGALLARKFRERFPVAAVSSFPIVGKGEHYLREGIPVDSVPEDSPSGGVIKYRLSDLWRDLRSGLLRSIARQMGAWKRLRGAIRTPVCVGDVYLLLHALWGQGQLPVLVATAKTVYLSGHWRLERFIIKHRSRIAWTRDRDTAEELLRSGATARFDGNPIMDLTCDNTIEKVAWGEKDGFRVLLLPGSRSRAYQDVRLLLDAVELLSERVSCSYLMVIAPTLDMEELLASCRGWTSFEEDGRKGIRKGKASISLFFGPLPAVTEGAHLLIGLGGTANQVCAGMGVPVVSIEEKGKFVQKKLLGESELLVPPTARDLAGGAEKILADEELRLRMAREGRERLGGPGALDMVVEHTASAMGWELRCEVYSTLSERWGSV
jgi:tetraacyldisaccharide 4'-kinase